MVGPDEMATRVQWHAETGRCVRARVLDESVLDGTEGPVGARGQTGVMDLPATMSGRLEVLAPRADPPHGAVVAKRERCHHELLRVDPPLRTKPTAHIRRQHPYSVLPETKVGRQIAANDVRRLG